jgi:hypothetical protein
MVAMFDSILLAGVLGQKVSSPLMVANRHAAATNRADHNPLQKRRSFPRRTLGPIQSIGLCTLPEPLLIILILLEGYVAFMNSRNQGKPFFSRTPPVD